MEWQRFYVTYPCTPRARSCRVALGGGRLVFLVPCRTLMIVGAWDGRALFGPKALRYATRGKGAFAVRIASRAEDLVDPEDHPFSLQPAERARLLAAARPCCAGGLREWRGIDKLLRQWIRACAARIKTIGWWFDREPEETDGIPVRDFYDPVLIANRIEEGFTQAEFRDATFRSELADDLLFDTILRMHGEIGPFVTGDLLRYPTGFARHLVRSAREWLMESAGHRLSPDWYRLVIRSTPRWLRRLETRGFVFGTLLDALRLGLCPAPLTAFQYDLLQFELRPIRYPAWRLAALSRARARSGPPLPGMESVDTIPGEAEETLAWLRSLATATLPDNPAAEREIMARIVIRTVEDGRSIHRHHRSRDPRIRPVPKHLSFARQLALAGWNHRCFEKLAVQDLLVGPDRELPSFPGLPEALEALRIKTEHDLIRVGQELGHCIGSLADERHAFLREGTVCLQLDPERRTVVQCFDAGNRITAASRRFARRVRGMLQEWENGSGA